MVIKKFIAKSLPEALTKVKQDFGDEAVILKTRFNNRGTTGPDSKIVEVTAAIDKSAGKTRISQSVISAGSAKVSAGEAGKLGAQSSNTSIKIKRPSEVARKDVTI